EAMLVHTEDLGMIHSSPLLRYQADFENERKWFGIDLLCGKVDKEHPLRKFVTDHGISEEELNYFQQNSCVPSILGFNYYITSERYLDENVEHYPFHKPGGNGIHQYVDVEAIRCDNISSSGLKK